MSDGSVIIEVELTKEQLKKELKELKSDFNELEQTKCIDYLQKGFDKLGDILVSTGKKLTVGLTAPITALATAGIKYNAQLEKYKSALTTLTGSAQEAEKIMKQIEEDAAKTPFDVAGLTQANQLLISTGLSAKESRETILALGDAVSATGGGNDELSRMAVNLQQIKNTGKATALDIKQFAYAGIDIYGLLADYTGKTKAEVAEMEVTWESLNGALLKASKEGGKYFGAMEKQSKTTNGAISNLEDSFNRFTSALTKNFMPLVKKVINKITDWLEKFEKLDKSTKNNIIKAGLLVGALGPALIIIGKLSKGISNLIKVGKGVTQIISLVKNGTSAVKALSTVLGTANVGMLGIVGTIGAIVGVLAIAKNHMDSFKTSTTNTNERLKESIKSYTEEREAILKTQQDTINAEISQMDNAQRLANELRTITDENGKVKEGYKQRAEFIVNELNKALGTEMSLNGDIIQGYKEIQGEIDNLILKKKAQIILSAQEEAYTNAIKNQAQALKDLNDAQNNVENARKDLVTATSARARAQAEMDLQTAIKNLGEQKKVVQQYYDDITLYETNAMRITSGNQEDLKKVVESVGKTFVDNGKLVESSFKETMDAQRIAVEQAQENYRKQIKNADDMQKKILENQVATSKEQLQNTINTLVGMTSTVENDESVINAWKYIAENSYWEFNDAIKDLPEPLKKAIQEMVGTINENKTISNSLKQLGTKATDTANSVVTQTVKSADLTLESLGKSGWLQNSATEIGKETALNLGQPEVAQQAITNTMNVANNAIKNSEAIPEAKKHVIQSATAIAQEFDKSNEAYTSGDNTVWGAQRGIKNSGAWNSIKTTLTTGGSKIIGWFNKALGEHSPSKYTEQSGIYLGEGFINGIDKIQHRLNESAKGMGNELIDKINSTVSLETGRISTKLSTTALNSTSFTANINVTGNTYMDSEKVGRMTAPTVAKTFRGGGAYAN